MNSLFKKRLIVEGIVVACAAPLAFADFLDLPTTPLITASAVEPNLMLLIDSSGSMSNIVPDLPYQEESDDDFVCDGDNQLTNVSSAVSVRIQSDGDVYFYYGSTYYDFGNGSDNGVTDRTQKCFDDDLTYNTVYLYANTGTDPRYPSGYASASYTGHYLNWYFSNKDNINGEDNNFGAGARKKPSTFTRMEIAQNSAIELITGLADIRVGLTIYNGSTGGQIVTNIAALDDDHKALLISEIEAINNNGETPLGESLADIGRYFTLGGTSSSLEIHPDADGKGTSVSTSEVFTHTPLYLSNLSNAVTAPTTLSPVIQNWCQQNFVVALTDGAPSYDDSVSTYLKTYDNGGDIFDDVALALYDIDLRPDLNNNNDEYYKNNVATYVIGFADETVTHSTLMENAAENGGGEFYAATSSTQLDDVFSNASQSIFAQVASWSAVSFNSTQISDDSKLYQASFNTSGWSGSLESYALSDEGDVATDASWDAATVLDAMTYTDRKIFTYTGSSGIEFTSANFNSFSTTLQNDLYLGVDADEDDNNTNDVEDAALLINYLRGDTSNEGSESKNYRTRSSRLGDIVNSTSVYVGAPDLDWPSYTSNSKFGASGESYAAYKTAQTERTPMIYVGANDGMLHGFNASTGTENLAYIPASIASDSDGKGLHYLADQNYAHQFYVDLTPTVSDVYIGKKDALTTKAWRSVLIGGLRAGGKGLFALNVSNPTAFAAADVLWEFSSANDLDFGYSYSRPTVAMMANGQWAVIVGNGYNNSGDGHAKLFILFIEAGLDGTWTADTDYIELDTGVGGTTTPNGLSTPTVVDTDGDSVADRVYAGDLQGNMWVFNISDATAANWKVIQDADANPKPLFSAVNSDTEVQPITSAPTVTTNPSSVAQNAPNLLVFFGTGKYLEETDISGNLDVMSYYAVLDDSGSTTKTRDNLAERKLLTTTSGLRSISGSDIDWDDDDGWYVDLVDRSTIGGDATAYGERVISDSLVSNSIIFFNTIIPTGDECSSGGDSWLMSLSLTTGLAPKFAIFDANGDGDISDSSTDSTDANGDGVADNGDLGYVGQSFDNGLASESSILSNVQYTMGSTGVLSDRDVNTSGGSESDGRVSWQELIRD